MKRNNGVPKTRHVKGYNVEKEQLSRLGLRALHREQLETCSPELLDPMVHGEQLEPLGSALSSRPQYIVVWVAWLKSMLDLRALHREQLETCGSALYLESSSSFWTPWSTESRRRAARAFGLRATVVVS